MTAAAPSSSTRGVPREGAPVDTTRSLPSRTVTFLFTDIEGSTRLWEKHPDAMRVALDRHNTILRLAIEAHGGSVFKTVGDQFCTAFPTAPDALAGALDAQRALLAEPWSEIPALRVRMALHTGVVQEQDGDYFGPPLNRVARLLKAAHGGQTLLSLAAEAQVLGALPDGAGLRDLGAHHLPDLQQPENVFQLVHTDLSADFPPIRTLDVLPHNLPRQLTAFIGREKEFAEVRQLLSSSPLLTLTGAGGCGKTRLALQVAADLLRELPDGVWLVELAALTDPTLVPQAVAAGLGIREEPGRPLTQMLLEYLRPRVLLLVLDNCEHLLDACARLAADLLQSCPDLRVLATSRESLGLAGEQSYRVPSLSLPDPEPWLGEESQGSRIRIFDYL
jgi:class 3 adenylate cyclase